jgi:type I restriction enzyme S subunit
MSRISDLVTELGRSGIERVPLGDLATQYVDPIRVQPEQTYVNLGVKWHGEGAFAREPKAGREIKATTLYRVKPGQFIYNRMFVTEGSFGLVTEALMHGVVSNEFPVYDLDMTRILPEWLLLKFQDPATVNTAAAEAAGSTKSRRRWRESQFEAFAIDLPPLPVQQEVVRVLDSFRSLQAALQAELEARRRQYAHYRDSLLTLREGAGRWVPMGELGQLIRGRRFTKDDVVEAGVPSIHYGEIYTHYGVATTSTVSHIRSDLADQLRFAQPGDVVIAAVGETVDDVPKAVAWLGDEPVAIHDDTFLFRSELDPKFVSYAMQTAAFHAQKRKHVARAKVKRLGREGLAKIQIPVPPFAEQRRIVSILDTFDSLVNDLSFGLPAEIAARREQYEYYRDRLLAFEELAA